jgi:hypothetical protein
MREPAPLPTCTPPPGGCTIEHFWDVCSNALDNALIDREGEWVPVGELWPRPACRAAGLEALTRLGNVIETNSKAWRYVGRHRVRWVRMRTLAQDVQRIWQDDQGERP